jgi:hypothetical protein
VANFIPPANGASLGSSFVLSLIHPKLHVFGSLAAKKILGLFCEDEGKNHLT